VFGGLRLSQLVLPGMRRAGAGRIVTVSSVAGRVSVLGGGAYHASKFALEALADALRPEVEPFGVKVVNVLTGPLDIEWFQTVPPPKVAPRAVASAIVSALKRGLEDVFVGDVAEDIRQRLAANPKAVERELGA